MGVWQPSTLPKVKREQAKAEQRIIEIYQRFLDQQEDESKAT